jgi:hypothetical protein
VDELVTWLRSAIKDHAAELVCIVEDLAGEARACPGDTVLCDDELVAALRADVEAKLRLIEFCSLTRVVDQSWDAAYYTLACLAQPHASRPGFRDEWRLA